MHSLFSSEKHHYKINTSKVSWIKETVKSQIEALNTPTHAPSCKVIKLYPFSEYPEGGLLSWSHMYSYQDYSSL